jgi:hypothetical protein
MRPSGVLVGQLLAELAGLVPANHLDGNRRVESRDQVLVLPGLAEGCGVLAHDF